ncbi:MAG: hypothetical protein JHC93_05055 [Parachlamydiales bacterium]|nr:hypothetical protein [Parachlamydiales bacterium]
MKHKKLIILNVLAALILTGCAHRVRTACDVTPGNAQEHRLDWKYGATDLRIQTTKILSSLMDRWECSTRATTCKPCIVITPVDNRTHHIISCDMIRDIFESAAAEDGRFTVVVGDFNDESALDKYMQKIQTQTKYDNDTRLEQNGAIAPQLLAKVRITEAITHQNRFDLEDYRMTVNLFDIQSQELIDSAYDVLSKKVRL